MKKEKEEKEEEVIRWYLSLHSIQTLYKMLRWKLNTVYVDLDDTDSVRDIIIRESDVT